MEPSHRPLRIAVIGAGIGGLACARVLKAAGHHVRVWDKGRGPGGRASTRRVGTLHFDHGAQYFTAQSPPFSREVAEWQARGVIAEWQAPIAIAEGGTIRVESSGTRRWVGVPGMSAIAQELGRDLDLVYSVAIESLQRDGSQWVLIDRQGERSEGWDAAVINAPAPQAAILLQPVPDLAAAAASVAMTPCIAGMVAFETDLELNFGGAFLNDDPVLSWVANQATKPGRPTAAAWTLHATPAWSAQHLDAPREIQADVLLQAFLDRFDLGRPKVLHLDAHRWAYAIPPDPHPETYLFDRETMLLACGDWCGAARVEGAYLSGCAAAVALLG